MDADRDGFVTEAELTAFQALRRKNRAARRYGNGHPNIVPYNAYPTRDGMISDLSRTDDTQAWLDRLLAAGVSCAPINTVEQALTAAHTVARGLVTTAQHATEGEIKIPGIPFRFTRDPASVRRAPPTLGEHTDEVLRGLLGKSDQEIAALRGQGVI